MFESIERQQEKRKGESGGNSNRSGGRNRGREGGGGRDKGREIGRGREREEEGVLVVFVGYCFQSGGSMTTFVGPIRSCYPVLTSYTSAYAALV